jgi:DNA-binding NtrC family response regulator
MHHHAAARGAENMTRVLVIDDESTAISGLRALLELDGYDVVALDSSPRAQELIRNETFDVVITDLEMPVVSGIDIVRAAMLSRPSMPVLILTGYGDSPAALAALQSGARCIIEKPVDYDHLARELEALLRSSDGG